jgi:Family of unknown function (DUF6502)
MVDNLKLPVLMACRQLLRPIVRFLIKCGVSWREFSEVAKTAYVEVATAEFGIRGRPTNSSKVAILTGLGRREVARQREMLAETEQREPTYLNSATRVLSGWHQDADYLDDDGRPREIPAVGTPPSFEDLCRRYGGDIPYSALLKELRAVGAVSRGDDSRLSAQSRVYIPLQVDPAKVLRAGSVLQDIGATVVHDLTVTPKQALRFERRATNDRIAARHEAAFRAFLEAEGQGFLERADEWLTRHEATEQEIANGEALRLGVGVYHLQSEINSGKPS